MYYKEINMAYAEVLLAKAEPVSCFEDSGTQQQPASYRAMTYPDLASHRSWIKAHWNADTVEHWSTGARKVRFRHVLPRLMHMFYLI
jgi:hypothetical protein